eukprot:5798046-Pleurochrysis_carterae.AAC.1
MHSRQHRIGSTHAELQAVHADKTMRRTALPKSTPACSCELGHACTQDAAAAHVRSQKAVSRRALSPTLTRRPSPRLLRALAAGRSARGYLCRVRCEPFATCVGCCERAGAALVCEQPAARGRQADPALLDRRRS